MMCMHSCPDIDGLFQKYLSNWMETHANEIGTDLERAEEAVPDVYETFLNTPNEELAWEKPHDFFKIEENVDGLIDWLCEYHALEIPIPDLLVEQIVDQGKEAEAELISLLWQAETDMEIRLLCVSMLRELGSVQPMEDYVNWIACSDAGNELAGALAESLAYMGKEATERIISRFPDATDAGKDLFCDILAGAPYDTRIAVFLRERFEAHPENLALYASYLAKHGDEGALPLLMNKVNDPDLQYLDFIELANAIEQLGGERPAEREFAGDPCYEALKNL